MIINLKDSVVVKAESEKHFKLNVNGLEILVSKYTKFDEFDTEAETEIFKGKVLLTEEEQQQVIDFVNNLDD